MIVVVRLDQTAYIRLIVITKPPDVGSAPASTGQPECSRVSHKICVAVVIIARPITGSAYRPSRRLPALAPLAPTLSQTLSTTKAWQPPRTPKSSSKTSWPMHFMRTGHSWYASRISSIHRFTSSRKASSFCSASPSSRHFNEGGPLLQS